MPAFISTLSIFGTISPVAVVKLLHGSIHSEASSVGHSSERSQLDAFADKSFERDDRLHALTPEPATCTAQRRCTRSAKSVVGTGLAAL